MKRLSIAEREAALLASAIKILGGASNNEGPIMSKATADVKRAEMKAAAKKLETQGIRAPKHARHEKLEAAAAATVLDAGVDSVVESELGTGAAMLGIVSQLTGPTIMKKTPEELTIEKAAAKLVKDQEKTDKKAFEATAKAAKLAEATAAKEAKAKAIADAKEAKAALATAAKEARVPRERTYDGPMKALADASTRYTKGENGQLNNGDELAQTLGKVPAAQVVGVVLQTLGLGENPYAHLNYGQQSMNLRNKLRGAIRKNLNLAAEGEEAVHVTLDRVAQFVSALVPAAE